VDSQDLKKTSSPLLLLGVSRSGTTLFQRILNSYEDVIVWGEHAGYLNNLAESYFQLVDSQSMEKFSFPQSKGNSIVIEKYKDPKQWQAWNNWFNKDDIDNIYRKLVINTFASRWKNDLAYWGFKEIRYGEGDRVVDFFIRLFPDVRVVIIYRNPMNVIESQLTSFNNTGGRLGKLRKLWMLPKIIKMALRWNKKNMNYLSYAKKYPDLVVFVSFESLVSDIVVLQDIMGKLGLQLTERQLEVLNMREGRGSAFSCARDKKEGINNRWKKLGFIPAVCVFLSTYYPYKKIKVFEKKMSSN